MKQISTSLANKLKKDSIVERDYIIFKEEKTRHYIWFNLYDDCYKDGNFIGTFILKRIELKYNDSDLEFKNKEFNAYKEFKLNDNTWESINYGTFIVTDVKPSDTKEEVSVTAYDYGLKFANPYISELNYASGNVTLKNVLQEVCDKCNVKLATQTFENDDFIVDSNQFVETTTFGNVVSAVAQISCNFAKIKNDNKLYLELKNETNVIINLSDYEELKDKRDTQPYNAVSIGLSDIEGENVSIIAEGVNPKNAKYLIINDNPFAYTEIKRTQLIQAIFDKINKFGYSSFILENCLYPQLECGDLIQIKNKEGQSINSIILRPSFEEIICNFEAPSTISSTVKYIQPLSAIDLANRAERKVDKQNKIISDVVQEVSEYDNRITRVEEDVDSISQQVNQITDLTRESTGIGTTTTNENTFEGYVVNFKLTGNIIPLYPSEDLYPNSFLYPRPRKYFLINKFFIENEENENIEETETYQLPFDYLTFLEDVYDEFVIDEEGNAKKIKKIGFNSLGKRYILTNPEVIDYGKLYIKLHKGINQLTCNYSNASIYVKYAIKNDYTDIFATKVELNSSIEQTSESIMLEVNKKVDDDEFNTVIEQTSENIMLEVNKKVDDDEIISSINLSEEDVTIQSNKISLEGVTTINNNFQIDENGDMSCTNATINGIVKGSTIRGMSNNSIELKIGTEIDDTILPTDNSLEIIRTGERMLSFGARYWNSIGLRQLVIKSEALFFTFAGFEQREIVSAYEFRNKGGGFTNSSQESLKKNIEKLDNAIEIIKKGDIYKYNMKVEDDFSKKHIGFVIADEGGDFETPEEVINNDGTAIDLYSMLGVCWEAIKEQQKMIDDLKKEIIILRSKYEKNNQMD